RSYRPGVAFGFVVVRGAIGGRIDRGPVGDVDRWLRLASRRRFRSVRTGARADSPVIRALFADDRLRQEERGLEIGGFGARRRGRRSRRGAGLADVAQVVDAGEDVLADAAAHQALAQLQLVGDDLEARLALGTGGRERHRARSWSGGSEGPGDHACLVPRRQAQPSSTWSTSMRQRALHAATSSTCLSSRPARRIVPPGRPRLSGMGASNLSGLARMLASTMSAGAGAGLRLLRISSVTWLALALSAVLAIAWSSMSMATTSRAPSRAAAMARIPDPQP